MKLRFAPLLLVGLSWTANPVSTEPTPDEANAAIETLGGLVRLDENKAVVSVSLIGTNVTDAGLVHLKGLTKLEYLNLNGTKVTDAGIKQLQQTLPNCKITR